MKAHAYLCPGSILRCCTLLLTGFLSLAAVHLALGDTRYVSPSGTHLTPFTNWVTAATNIQDAIGVTVAGETVLVTNGVYDTGGVVVRGSVTNRIAVTNEVTVRSVNGPGDTVILGTGPAGETAVRCAYIGDNALLKGFTLSNGHTRTDSPTERPPTEDLAGGGAFCELSARVSNCVISGNSAYYGGGAYLCTVQNSTISGNNSVHFSGGTRFCTVQNSIVYHNTATDAGNNYQSGTGYEYTCTTPDPGGAGNIINAPQFVGANASDFRLLPASPCIDAGTNLAWMAGTSDLDGHPRIINGTTDMGAHESPSPAITGLTPPMLSVGSVITWASFSNAQYAVYGSSDLAHGYDILLQDGIPAIPPENTYTDTVKGVALRGYAVEFRHQRGPRQRPCACSSPGRPATRT